MGLEIRLKSNKANTIPKLKAIAPQTPVMVIARWPER